MITCTRKIEFDAAHRVLGHEFKCKYLHGHRYVLEASFLADELDLIGRVIDFGIIKKILGGWIDDNWDHTTILFNQDEILGKNIEKITNQKIYYLPSNPTCENLVHYLFYEICPKLFENTNVRCVKLKLYETPNAYCEIS